MKRNRNWRKSAVAVLTAAALITPNASIFAEDAETAAPRTPIRNFLSDGAAIVSTPFLPENRRIALGVAAAVGAAALVDNAIQSDFYPTRREETPEEFRQGGDMLQFAGLAYGTVIGARGIVFDNARDRWMGVLSYETYAWSAAVLGTLKLVSGRRRPSESGNPFRFAPKEGGSSFPSGHTTQAFAAATLISEEYKSWYVTIPAYAAASSVGVSRALANKHWASDVVAGACLGTMVAHVLRKRYDARAADGWRVEADGEGLRLSHAFQ